MEWNEVMNQIIQILIPALATFLTGLFTYLGTKLKDKYKEKIDNETKKQVVQDVVQFVEQVYKDLNGEEKLKKALDQVYCILDEKGLKISETEINMLIESAVYGLHQGFNKDNNKKKKLEEKK